MQIETDNKSLTDQYRMFYYPKRVVKTAGWLFESMRSECKNMERTDGAGTTAFLALVQLTAGIPCVVVTLLAAAGSALLGAFMDAYNKLSEVFSKESTGEVQASLVAP